MSERNGAAPSPAAGPAVGDDLRSAIAGALAEARPTEPAAPAGGEGGAQSPGSSPAPAGTEPRPGREDARSGAATPGEGGAAEAGEPESLPLAGTEPAPGPNRGGGAAADGAPPEAPGAKPGAPEHWSAADKQLFDGLPEAAKSPFLDLYKRMESGLSPKLQRGAQLEKDYGELDRTVFTRDQREIIRQKGYTPSQLVNSWAEVERGLGGQNRVLKAQIAARIIHNYAIEPGEVAQILHQLRGFPAVEGGDRPAPAANGGAANGAPAANGAVDPALAARLDALEQDAQRRRAETEAAAYRGAGEQITQFANEADAQGVLKHPFFADLEADMTGLAQIDRMQGKTPVLQDLYDRALWANPSTRERHLAAQRDAEAKRAADERKAKAEQARRAGSSVTGGVGAGQANGAASPDMGLRDLIKANLHGGPQTSGGPGRI